MARYRGVCGAQNMVEASKPLGFHSVQNVYGAVKTCFV